jgi:hypothetical protein
LQMTECERHNHQRPLGLRRFARLSFILPSFLLQPPLFPSFHLVSSHSKHSYDSTPLSHPSNAAHTCTAFSNIPIRSPRLDTMVSLRSTPCSAFPAPVMSFLSRPRHPGA